MIVQRRASEASEPFEHPQGQPCWPSNTPKGLPWDETQSFEFLFVMSIFGLPRKYLEITSKRASEPFEHPQGGGVDL